MIDAWQELIRELDSYEDLRFVDMVVDGEDHVTVIGCDGQKYFLFAGNLRDTTSASRLGPANGPIERSGEGENSFYTYVGQSDKRTTIARSHLIEHYISDKIS